MTTRISTDKGMKIDTLPTRPRHRAWPRLGAFALVTFLVAMAFLPLATPGVAAEEEESAIVEIVPVDAATFEVDQDALDEIPEVVIQPSPEIEPDAPGDIPDVEIADDEPALGDVTAFKYDCPAGIDLEFVSQEQLFAECTEVMEGVAFHLATEFDDRVEVTNASGEAYWADVPMGAFDLIEEIPAGYGDPFVSCGWGTITDGVAIDGMVPLQLAPGGYLSLITEYPGVTMGCFWFNIPLADDGSITVVKHTCPPGYDPDAVGADPEVDCPSLTNGVAFSLWQGLNPAGEGVTGDAGDGMVAFGELGAGDYHLVEAIPASIVAIFVECTSAVPSENPLLGPALAYFQPAVLDGGIDLSLISGEEIVCHWYNVPAEEPDGGELIVYKYWCDGAVYTVATCELYGGGAEFGLQAAGGEGDPILFNTGADGFEVLYLPATTWSLWEIGREWCRAESDDVDGEGNIVVTGGGTAEVYVFNCGPGKEKEPPVTEFPNTGSGTTAGPEGDPIILNDSIGGLLLGVLQMIAAALISSRAMGLTPDLIRGAARAAIRA